jgi:fructose-1,6-bisphosphatase/inositol monophosphatase family enzyme
MTNIKLLKSDQSYVSEGDLLSQQIICEYFNQLNLKHCLISEEQPIIGEIAPAPDALIVVVDPIDGTENFVSGLKEWGIGISVYRGDKHIESLIALPELNQYLPSGGSVQKFQSRICGLSSSLDREDLLKLEVGFEYRIIGCCMYNMLNVIRGSYKSFENPRGARSWDILPGLNLALEHGLQVSVENEAYHGQFLQPTGKYRFKIRNV